MTLNKIVEIKRLNILCGIYFLMNDNEVVYVGQSIDIHRRINKHKESKTFDKIYYLEVDKQNLDEIEKKYILEYQPIYNKTYLNKYNIKEKVQKIYKCKSYIVDELFKDDFLRYYFSKIGSAI